MAYNYTSFFKQFNRKRTNDPFNPFYTIARNLRATQEQAKTFKEFRIELVVTSFSREGGITLPAQEDVLAGKVIRRGRRKGTKNSVFTVDDYIAGLEALDALFKSGRIVKIITRNYDQTVRRLLKRKINNHHSLERGGGAGSNLFSTDQEEEGNQSVNKLRRASRSAGELGELWREVLSKLDVPLNFSGNISDRAVLTSFNLGDMLKVQIDSDRSRFTGVYLMGEFGTGIKANPGPRRYKSSHETPYKVSPALADLYGGSSAMWFTSPLSVFYGNLAVRKKAEAARKHKRFEASRRNPLDFALGGKDAIPPARIIFDNRGVVADLRAAYYQFYRQVIEDINDLISEEVPFWPKNAIKLNETTGPLAIIQRIEGLFSTLQVNNY